MALPAHHGTGVRTKDGMLYRREHPQAPGCSAEVKHVTGGGVFYRVVTKKTPNPQWTPATNVPAAIQIADAHLSRLILEAVRADAKKRAALRTYPAPCPTCSALAGQPCRTASGAATKPHAARIPSAASKYASNNDLRRAQARRQR